MHMQAAAGTNAAAANFTLPVALHGLENWAALVGRMCQSGATSHEESSACLARYFNHTNTLLESLVSRTCLNPFRRLLGLRLALCA